MLADDDSNHTQEASCDGKSAEPTDVGPDVGPSISTNLPAVAKELVRKHPSYVKLLRVFREAGARLGLPTFGICFSVPAARPWHDHHVTDEH